MVLGRWGASAVVAVANGFVLTIAEFSSIVMYNDASDPNEESPSLATASALMVQFPNLVARTVHCSRDVMFAVADPFQLESPRTSSKPVGTSIVTSTSNMSVVEFQEATSSTPLPRYGAPTTPKLTLNGDLGTGGLLSVGSYKLPTGCNRALPSIRTNVSVANRIAKDFGILSSSSFQREC